MQYQLWKHRMTKPKYREIKPSGKCPTCTINVWAEHGDKPAPHTLPCTMGNCPHKTTAEVLPFHRSIVGSSLAMIEG